MAANERPGRVTKSRTLLRQQAVLAARVVMLLVAAWQTQSAPHPGAAGGTSAAAPRENNDRRVFIVGMPKAGTTTLDELFNSVARRAGMQGSSCHQHFYDAQGRLVRLGAKIYEAYQRNLPLLQLVPSRCRFLSQLDFLYDPFGRLNCAQSFWPQMTLLRELDQQYPGSKFILNTRPIKDHIKSIDNWIDLRQRLVQSNVPGLPPGKGAKDAELQDWIEGHNQAVRDHFRGRDADFMEFKLGKTSISEVCSFIQALTSTDECPEAMPHANAGPYKP